MKVHLLDGTYELFRQYFGRPSHRNAAGEEVSATGGVLASVIGLLEAGVTHLGVATDHVIESFRNRLWAGYKTSEGVPADLLAQFPLLEEAVAALGVAVWPMVDLEADDALASAAVVAAEDPRVTQVVLLTPDKDLAQCVSGTRVVQVDRRRWEEATPAGVVDEAAVLARYGVGPASIPDWLALVGDSADGFPGLPGWGPKSTSAVLGRYRHLEAIPEAAGQWEVTVRGGATLAATLTARRDQALAFRDLATLRIDRSLLDGVEGLAWAGPTEDLPGVCDRLDRPELADRATRMAAGPGAADPPRQ
ncbi:MAG TPA: 5'-3' exonuclease H3TH domain-containing protein [Acidimicrobiales bacterium]|nr:5'-3' exonuclease H3TH domain-containing protein [Acidimicrobiales bacterium]